MRNQILIIFSFAVSMAAGFRYRRASEWVGRDGQRSSAQHRWRRRLEGTRTETTELVNAGQSASIGTMGAESAVPSMLTTPSCSRRAVSKEDQWATGWRNDLR
jgi:hypothetical protein